MQQPTTTVEKSQNSKLGKGRMDTTNASQTTCPESCPFLNSGCYTESGNQAFTTNRLNSSPEKSTKRIAEQEAESIRNLSGKRNLRVHVVGDCPNPQSAEIVSRAMKDFQEKSKALGFNKKAFTYTHGWRRVKAQHWNGQNVLASCENKKDIMEAKARGYKAFSLVVKKFESKKLYKKDGLKILPCPNQTMGTVCDDCRLCLDTDKLGKLGLIIGFESHGTHKQKTYKAIE